MKLNYLIISLVTIATSVIGSRFTSSGMEWYKTINLPSWKPPGSVIGVVWAVIFILSAISVLIVWNSFERNNIFGAIIILFILNAILNIFWSYLFFNLHLMGWAIAEMIILELTVLALIILIWPTSRLASFCLFLYAGWVLFATYLASNIYLLNR